MVFFPSIPICHKSRTELSAYFRQAESFPAWIALKLSLSINILTWEKNPIISCRCGAVFYYGDQWVFHTHVSSSCVVQTSSVIFGKVSLLQKPPLLERMRKTLGYWLQRWMCPRCIYLCVPPTPLLSVTCSVRWLTAAYLFVQNGNVCCSVDLECLSNNWHSQTGLCQEGDRGRWPPEMKLCALVFCTTDSY